MLAANVLDVAKVLWNGQMVDAVRNEYVLRMPQTNAATAKSPLDYQSRTPVVQTGWSVQSLGSGFFRLSAPGASVTTVTSWAQRQGAQSIDVNRVSKAARAPNDTLYGDASNWGFSRISAPSAWDTGTGTDTTIVSVLDSGVDYNNVDLAANMWRNPNEIPGDGRDNDNNGYIDDIFGINALNGSSDPMDTFGHGTVVAGLIGAVGNNARGLAGVNWTVRIMAVRVMDDNGNVPISAELTGIQYVLQQKLFGQNIAVVNCSFGRYGFTAQEFSALDQLAKTGINIVAAAGNDSNDNDSRPFYPANYDIVGLISVAATDQNDDLAWFSNFGARTVDLAAPGVDILSTRSTHPRVSTSLYQQYTDRNYTIADNYRPLNEAPIDGTSSSAAFVSGAVALLKSLKLGSSTQQIKDAILNGVDKVPSLTGRVLTGGRLNLKKSVDLILTTTAATPVASFKPGQLLTVVEGNQGYSYADIKIILDRPVDPGKSCSVWYETRPGGSAFADVDFVSQAGFLTFSNSEVEKSIRIPIIGDRLPEADEQFGVRLDFARSRGVTIGTVQANVIIRDDDNLPGPSLPNPTNNLVPRLALDVKRDASQRVIPMVEGGTGTFVVTLDRTSNKPITVKYRTSQPVLVPAGTALENLDYTPTSGTLTFRPGERTKEFTVRISADRLTEGTETFDALLFDPINAEVEGGNARIPSTSTAAATRTGSVTTDIVDVPVSPPSRPGFQITLNYLGDVPAAIRTAAEFAAARWMNVITGDLPDVVDPLTGTRIDDILINVQAGLLDTPQTDGRGGTLANAAPEQFRTTGTRLPWLSSVGFDLADIADPLLPQYALHEFGHALGFTGTLFAQKGLLATTGLTGTGVGFIGANALREYRSIFGVPNALNVPIDTTGGAGTAGSHWDEATFGNELMTGFVGGATSLPLSRVTIGAMQDLGYTVNYRWADAYTRPARPATTNVAATSTSLRNNAAFAALAAEMAAGGTKRPSRMLA